MSDSRGPLIIAGAGLAIVAGSFAMAWDFLAPASPPDAYVSWDQLSFTLSDVDGTTPIDITHSTFADSGHERVIFISKGPFSVSFGVLAVKGSPAPEWACGAGDGPLDEVNLTSGRPGSWTAAWNSVNGNYFVGCSRSVGVRESLSQGLEVISVTSVSGAAPEGVRGVQTDEVYAPLGWELQNYPYRGTVRSYESAGDSIEYGAATRDDEDAISDDLTGAMLYRNTLREADIATRAWISALTGGAGVALMLTGIERWRSQRARRSATAE